MQASVPTGEINGIFLNGFNPIREEVGWDGVAGTADDACAGTGPCTVAGQPTNSSPIVTGFQRQIVITDIDDPERQSPPNPITRRQIDVTIRYFVNQATRTESMSTMITNY